MQETACPYPWSQKEGEITHITTYQLVRNERSKFKNGMDSNEWTLRWAALLFGRRSLLPPGRYLPENGARWLYQFRRRPLLLGLIISPQCERELLPSTLPPMADQRRQPRCWRWFSRVWRREEQFSGTVGELHQRNCSSPFFLPIRSTNPHIFRRWRGATPRSRSGGGAVRRYPSFKVRSSSWLCWSSCKEIPHIQGKRNPSKTVGVERGHQSTNTLKP